MGTLRWSVLGQSFSEQRLTRVDVLATYVKHVVALFT